MTFGSKCEDIVLVAFGRMGKKFILEVSDRCVIIEVRCVPAPKRVVQRSISALLGGEKRKRKKP